MVFRALAQAPRAREAIKNIADNENRKTAPLTVLVTTPESLSLLLSRADAKETLASVRMVVVDEWHELIGKRSAVLRWNGGRWPLSSILADAVVEQFGLAHVGRYDTPEPQSMRPLLDIQQRRFREIARVSELIFQGYPGEKRSNKQQATSNYKRRRRCSAGCSENTTRPTGCCRPRWRA